MAKVMPYIISENAIDLLEHYNEIFGDVLVHRDPLTEEMAQKINYQGDVSRATMHMVMNFGGSLVMASDDMAGYGVKPQNILLDFDIDDEKHIAKIKDIASKFEEHNECKILMPLQEQFWGGLMGQYKDKFDNIFILHAQNKFDNIFMLHAQSYKHQASKGGVLESFYKK